MATYSLWWLTASGVWPATGCATAESGIMVSAAVATADPDDALLLPVLVSDACAAVRTALFAAVLVPLAVPAAH